MVNGNINGEGDGWSALDTTGSTTATRRLAAYTVRAIYLPFPRETAASEAVDESACDVSVQRTRRKKLVSVASPRRRLGENKGKEARLTHESKSSCGLQGRPSGSRCRCCSGSKGGVQEGQDSVVVRHRRYPLRLYWRPVRQRSHVCMNAWRTWSAPPFSDVGH